MKEDPDGTRKYRADGEWKRRQVFKEKIFEKLGNRCSNLECLWVNSDGSKGCTDKRCLQIDHVFGNGSEERKKLSGGTNKYLKIVLNDTENKYQLLCANCNWIKRRDNGEDNARNN